MSLEPKISYEREKVKKFVMIILKEDEKAAKTQKSTGNKELKRQKRNKKESKTETPI